MAASGFVVQAVEGVGCLIVTAAHTFHFHGGGMGSEMLLTFGDGKTAKGEVQYVGGFGGQGPCGDDVAIIVSKHCPDRYLTLIAADPQPGTTAKIVGYDPNNGPQVSTGKVVQASNGELRVSSIGWRGGSGGPIISPGDDAVIGLLTASDFTTGSRGPTAAAIRDKLKNYWLKAPKAPAVDDKAEEDGEPVYFNQLPAAVK